MLVPKIPPAFSAPAPDPRARPHRRSEDSARGPTKKHNKKGKFLCVTQDQKLYEFPDFKLKLSYILKQKQTTVTA
jgi:hypothetical protein